MEFVAWSNHKYVMHGFLWKWHKDHHVNDRKKKLPEENEESKPEKNDLFFLIYALPAIALIIIGLLTQYLQIFYAGIGITLYGFTYFLIHDVIIHKRIKISFLQRNHNFYMKALIKAHTAHHWSKNAADFNNFGLLAFPFHFLKK